MKLLRYIRPFLWLLLLNYALVGIVGELFHDHEQDMEFHADCPACQWKVQSQEPDTSLLDVFAAFRFQSSSSSKFFSLCDVAVLSDILIEDKPSRAPPVSS